MKSCNFINCCIVFFNFCFCYEMEIGFVIDYYYGSWIVVVVVIVKYGVKVGCLCVFEEFYFDYYIGVKVDIGEVVDYKLIFVVEIIKIVFQNGYVLIFYIDVVF